MTFGHTSVNRVNLYVKMRIKDKQVKVRVDSTFDGSLSSLHIKGSDSGSGYDWSMIHKLSHDVCSKQ